MVPSKTKRLLQISVYALLCLLLGACQTDDSSNPAPVQEVSMEQSPVDNEYHRALKAYNSLLRGEVGLNGDMSYTIVSTPNTKYAVIDMNDDGVPELAVTEMTFQERDPDTFELESTFFDSAIFSYNDGEVFIWYSGNHRHHSFEILSNKALLYDGDDGHGGREIRYCELDQNGDIAYETEIWNSPGGRFYFIDYSQSVSRREISEEDWHEIVDPILELRTDQIQWTENFENMIPLELPKGTKKTPDIIKAYLPVVANNDLEDVAFSLIYLDDDDVPELVICDRYYDKYSVYTIKNDSVECLVDSMITVEMSYFERKNIISKFTRWNGGGDEGGYASDYYQLDQYSETLTDNSIPSFRFSYVAVYDENGEWTGDGISEYYEKEKKIEKAAYDKIIADFDIMPDNEMSCFPEGRVHFTKEEMMAYLTEMVQ